MITDSYLCRTFRKMEQNSGNRMGFFSCVAVIVGACVGSAIFSISGVTLYIAGAACSLSWLIAALIYMAYGILLSELATKYPYSGGIYIFPQRAFGGNAGRTLGFFSGWGFIISNIIAVGFSATFVGIYLCAGFPSLATSPFSGQATAVLSIVLALVIISIGGKRSQIIQNTLTVILLSIMLLYCAFALFGHHFETANFTPFFTSGAQGLTGFVSAIPIAMVAYGGSIAIPFMASEVRNPRKNIPRTLMAGLGIVALLYIAIIISITGTVPFHVLDENPGLRFIPLFASISDGTLASFRWLSGPLAVCGIIALLTTMVVLLRINARAIQAISVQGFFPDILSREGSTGVLRTSVTIMALLAAILCLYPERATQMITAGAILNVVSMSITCLSLIRSRYPKTRRTGRSFIAPLGLFLPVAVLVIFLICYIPDIITRGSGVWLFSFIIYASGAILWFARRSTARKRLSGSVVHGKGHGHLHEMPTANLQVFEGQTLPEFGVWESKVFIRGKIFKGVTNVGLRPSDDDSSVPTVETIIIGFRGDIYDELMTLSFERYIRPTLQFPSLDELKKQIDLDIRNVTTRQ